MEEEDSFRIYWRELIGEEKEGRSDALTPENFPTPTEISSLTGPKSRDQQRPRKIHGRQRVGHDSAITAVFVVVWLCVT